MNWVKTIASQYSLLVEGVPIIKSFSWSYVSQSYIDGLVQERLSTPWISYFQFSPMFPLPTFIWIDFFFCKLVFNSNNFISHVEDIFIHVTLPIFKPIPKCCLQNGAILSQPQCGNPSCVEKYVYYLRNIKMYNLHLLLFHGTKIPQVQVFNT